MAGGAARAVAGGNGGNGNLNLEGFTGTRTGLLGAVEKMQYHNQNKQAIQDRNNTIATRGATMGTLVPGQSSKAQANDHTHEENNNAQPGGFFGAAATAVTGSPGAFGSHQPAGMAEVGGVAASSQPVRWGKAGMAANKAAIRQAGASNVMSQNQNGQDMFGGQSIPEKGAIGVAGMDQMEQF